MLVLSFPPLIDQVSRALQGVAQLTLFVVCVALNKDWIYSNSALILLHLLSPSLSFLPHFNSPWLLPTPIKHYKHKNPQALKSCPGEEKEEEEEEEEEE